MTTSSHQPLKPRFPALGPLLAISLVVALVVALVVGPGGVEVGRALSLLAGRLRSLVTATPPALSEADAIADAIVWSLRLPRALLAALVGATLGVAGALTQGLFRNPMAEPGVLGVSSGAAVASVLGFSLGLDALGVWVTPALAAAGAVAVLLALLALAGTRHGVATLLLAGIALSALCSALTTMMLALASERWDLGLKVVRWLMGSFEGRSWDHLAGALGPALLGLGAGAYLRRDLDTLQLGADTARSLGVRLERFQLLTILSTALLVGTATAVAGVIGFVGLIVPHVVRMLAGPGYRRLVPLSALLGGTLVVIVDTGSRAVGDFSFPPGVITSLLGAPFFLWILRRHARRVGHERG